ncbi:hypothetical protein HDV00_002529, partial [Rhizophlyctis rosea]
MFSHPATLLINAASLHPELAASRGRALTAYRLTVADGALAHIDDDKGEEHDDAEDDREWAGDDDDEKDEDADGDEDEKFEDAYECGEEDRRDAKAKGLENDGDEGAGGGTRSTARNTVAKDPDPSSDTSSKRPWSMRVPMRGVRGGRMLLADMM